MQEKVKLLLPPPLEDSQSKTRATWIWLEPARGKNAPIRWGRARFLSTEWEQVNESREAETTQLWWKLLHVVSILVMVHQSQLVSPHRGHPCNPHATTILIPTPNKMTYSLNAVNSCERHHALCLQFTSSFYYRRESVFQWLWAWWSKDSSLALSSAPHSKALTHRWGLCLFLQ